MSVTERLFEDHIEWWLLEHGGYTESSPANFDRRRGLGLVELGGFIQASQPKAWSRLVSLHGGEGQALAKLADRVAAEIDDRGTLDVLRHGVIDLGVDVRLAYFRPAHGLTSELEDRYRQNRVTLTRQLAYEEGSGKDIDLALLVNGIPTATAELKNPLTGQGIDHSVDQYRHDRDPANVTLSRRALVHFAVDPNEVKMTTKLAGDRTVFLPFNRGFDGGAGNPPNPDGHRTFYLWEWVWQSDAWLDMLHRFIHLSEPTEGSKAERRARRQIIFPRFHQWDGVRQLVGHARDHGAGRNYLVEHSAGSGKSNTIAWAAHRLSNLHDASDRKVFDKVVVITDRVILDRQLQDTIYQFEHVRGVVEKIDESSTQLAETLAGEQAKVIITTLQKFPFILDKVGELPDRRYAVIVDEAHSSQTGEGARELRQVLGSEAAGLAAAETEEAVAVADPQDEMADLVRGRGRQSNLSFFAFTATPKAKTLELFGTPFETAEGHRYAPFHLYTMRQAIEEGFILDVLAHYTTYHSYFKIERAIVEDPEYDERAAKAAIARFITLHPHNLAQKAEIVVEHFRQHTAGKIAGQAKAMVVTSSRLHAVRYKEAIDRYIKERGYTDVAALVAFSGTVHADGDAFTEANMNGFPESQTARRFDTTEYQVLIVAEKFQTGFDQPLLHTMFVDKVLTGLAAVQTLSRLNRIHPDKEDTFVLDFRNEAEDIQSAFRPWYEQTVAIETDPNLMYDLRRRLADYDLLRPDEVEALVAALQVHGREASPKTYAALDPALRRFLGLATDRQEEARDALQPFVSTYRFLSQVVTFTDVTLENDYLFAKALAAVLPGQEARRLDLGSEVKLTHLRIEQTYEGSASLKEGGGELTAIPGGGVGRQYELELEHLSRIVDQINERFGLDLGDTDQLLFDQYEREWLRDEVLAAQAQNNDLENFRLVFNRRFLDTIVQRMDSNEAIFKRVLDDAEFRAMLLDHYLERVFTGLRASTPPR